jgi:hypothetical protein
MIIGRRENDRIILSRKGKYDFDVDVLQRGKERK